MIEKHRVMASLRESGLVAVIRTENPGDLVAVCRALNKGGVKFVRNYHDRAQRAGDRS